MILYNSLSKKGGTIFEAAWWTYEATRTKKKTFSKGKVSRGEVIKI